MRMNVHLALDLPFKTTHNYTIGDAGRCIQTILNCIKKTMKGVFAALMIFVGLLNKSQPNLGLSNSQPSYFFPSAG
jgi:hypothetical protein